MADRHPAATAHLQSERLQPGGDQRGHRESRSEEGELPFRPHSCSHRRRGSIGLGALYYTIIASDAELSFATARVVGGLVFSLGLVLILVGGAELFTGNNLIVMAWASGKYPQGKCCAIGSSSISAT